MSSEADPVTKLPANGTTPKSSGSPIAAREKPKKISQEEQGVLEKAPKQHEAAEEDDDDDAGDAPEHPVKIRPAGGRRMVPVHQSRIADRPSQIGKKDSSLKIKIELDLEVEVEIYARIKGDITIGLL